MPIRAVLASALALVPAAYAQNAIQRADEPDQTNLTDERRQALAVAPTPRSEHAISRIAFGSCFDPRGEGRDIFASIGALDPDVFVMLGDNVYADTEDMDEMRAEYAALDAIEPFADLRRTTHFLATWDDHDYGQNDAGADYPRRRQSQQVFLDWAGEPAGTWRRTHPGVYDVEVFGPIGRRVQVILLDTRYFRGPLTRGSYDRDWADGVAGPYEMDFDSSSTMLGGGQWAWLERVLQEPADVRIIASSIQVIPEDHRFEKWANLPRERARLFELLERTGADGVVFISGDRHRAEISRFDPARATPNAGSFDRYPLHEVTSSALNRSSRGRAFEEVFANECNRHGVGNQYLADNFASITIDWDAGELALTIHRADGSAAITRTIALDQLRPPDAEP